MTYYQLSFDKLTFGQMTPQKLFLDQLTKDQPTFGQLTFGQLTFGQMTLQKLLLDELTKDQPTFGQLTFDKLTVEQQLIEAATHRTYTKCSNHQIFICIYSFIR